MRLSLLLSLLLAAGCDPEKDATLDTAAVGGQDDTGVPEGDQDQDGDGYTPEQGDCDDAAADVNPGADEVCNGLDDDCDGETDEDDATDATTWYVDADGDGFGGDDAVTACEPEAGKATAWVEETGDCDDSDAAYNPGAAEDDCTDPNDYNCDGSVGYADADGDGWAACEECDDTSADVNPGADEVCDGVDNDCDGETDEDDATDATTWYADDDNDGHGDAGDSTVACAQPSGFVAGDADCDDGDAATNPDGTELCDGLDNDCDGDTDEADAADAATWHADADGDGFGDAASTATACEAPSGYVDDAADCDDGAASVNPDEPEVCNGVDDDCDGTIDDEDLDVVDASSWYIDYDADGYGVDGAYTTEACDQPSGYVDDTSDCDDTEASINPEGTEVCNGVDDDCDALIDDADDSLSDPATWYADADGDGFGDADGDGFGDAASTATACEAPSGYVDDDTDCDDTDATAWPGADESWFDGIDSDCDGEEDPDPCESTPPNASIDSDETCAYTPTVGSFDPATEWEMASFDDYSDYEHIISAPMVGQMTDDDGDGDIDSDDTPDIASVAFYRGSSTYKGALRLVSGDGSEVHWTVQDDTYDGGTYAPYRYAPPALGDIDSDGEPEIAGLVTDGSSCYLGAWDNTGDLLWVYTGTSLGCRSHAPAIHDLEGDGDVEIVIGRTIVEGADGSLQAEGTGGRGYYSSYSNSGYHSFAIDLDGDGAMEVVAGSSVYGADGVEICSTGYTDGYPAVADLDGDGLGEIVVSGNSYIRIFEDDCSYVDGWSTYGGGYGGPVTLADFDGDGALEIASAARYYFTVYEQDGTRLWATSAITDDSSHSTGSSVFDFDGDGDAEVVYGDETDLWVFDGATGSTIYQDSSHGSGTVNEYPVIADVDGDGKAEIVVAHDNSATGLQVIGDANDEWVSARMVWNQHAYNITNVEDDLSIPAVPAANWPDYNSFRQGAPGGFSATSAPDLAPVVYDPCQSACGEDVDVLIQVANSGALRASADVEIAVYGEDGGGVRTELDRAALGSALDAGELSATYWFTFSAADLSAYDKLIAVVDDAGLSNECDETDNEAEIDLASVCE